MAPLAWAGTHGAPPLPWSVPAARGSVKGAHQGESRGRRWGTLTSPSAKVHWLLERDAGRGSCSRQPRQRSSSAGWRREAIPRRRPGPVAEQSSWARGSGHSPDPTARAIRRSIRSPRKCPSRLLAALLSPSMRTRARSALAARCTGRTRSKATSSGFENRGNRAASAVRRHPSGLSASPFLPQTHCSSVIPPPVSVGRIIDNRPARVYVPPVS